jgi:hypothetical protein
MQQLPGEAATRFDAAINWCRSIIVSHRICIAAKNAANILTLLTCVFQNHYICSDVRLIQGVCFLFLDELYNNTT